MKLGVDFGTTRIVVAAVDRGNYPIVSFESPEGVTFDWFPPLVGIDGSRCVYGWEAWSAQHEPGSTTLRSLKRSLEDSGPETRHAIGPNELRLTDLLSGITSALRDALLERSSLQVRPGEPLEIMLGVPANANGNQRFLTVEAFRNAGFRVLGLLNEPSAASIEYGHRNRAGKRFEKPENILVYDLGGGTFDVSLVETDELAHTVIASEGIAALGGDDFDQVLADIALELAGVASEVRDTISQAEWFRLHEECRVKKEALHPNSRKLVVDFDTVRESWDGLAETQIAVPVTEYYERCRPLMEETIHAVEDLLAAHNLNGPGGLEVLYVTGGGSELPLVARMLRDHFGRRVRRSAHTRSATAIGLAIQADASAGYVLREQFTRNFGVWREAETGRSVVFDVLFPKGVPLPGPDEPPLVKSRRYQSVHNVGHFRYLECSHLGPGGEPRGDIAVWDEIRFPLDPALESVADLSKIQVLPHPDQEIEERYSCDAGGTVVVAITNLSSGYRREFRLGRWAGKETAAPPKRRHTAR